MIIHRIVKGKTGIRLEFLLLKYDENLYTCTASYYNGGHKHNYIEKTTNKKYFSLFYRLSNT